jgi:hypothetical protein
LSFRFRNLARLHTRPTRRKQRCSHLALISPGASCEQSPIQLTRASMKRPACELGQRGAGRDRHQPNRPHAHPTAVTVAPTFPILLLRIGSAVMPSDRLFLSARSCPAFVLCTSVNPTPEPAGQVVADPTAITEKTMSAIARLAPESSRRLRSVTPKPAESRSRAAARTYRSARSIALWKIKRVRPLRFRRSSRISLGSGPIPVSAESVFVMRTTIQVWGLRRFWEIKEA